METRVDPGFSESVRIEARVKLSACGNATMSRCNAGLLCFLFVSCFRDLFRVLALCHTIVSAIERWAEDSMGEVERDAHYANKQTEDDDDEISRRGRWPVFCANTQELRKMIEVRDLIDVHKHRPLLAYHLIAIAFLESITELARERINDAYRQTFNVINI